MKEQKILIPSVILVVGLAVFAYLLKTHQIQCSFCANLKSFNPDVVKDYILSFGPWALIAFVALYALNTISILPPIGIMSLSAGYIFGPLLGTLGIMIGAFIGTTITFFIARKFGQAFVDQLIKGKGRQIEDKINRNGFVTVLSLRLIPLFPWEIINYFSGLTKIKYRDYILGTMIGIFPSIIIQTFFSDRISKFNIRDPQLWIAVIAFVLLIFLPVLYLKFKNDSDKP